MAVVPILSRCCSYSVGFVVYTTVRFMFWAASWQNQQNSMCAQWRFRSALASAQSDQSLRCALSGQWVAKDPSCLYTGSEDSDQTGRMPRLIWLFAGRTVILLVLSRGSLFVCLFCTCLFLSFFSLPRGVGGWPRFVVVALPGFFY